MDERQHPGSGPFPDPVDDFDVDTDFDEFTAWLDREVAAGRNPIPPERPTGQGISLSLGEERTFVLKHKRSRAVQPVHLRLASGSLLLMKGDTQRHWRHGVPKANLPCGPRVNLTFRMIVR